MTTSAARSSGRSSNSACASVPATPDSSLTTCEIAAVYGRAAISASWARRSFAVETSFIARVILRVFLTDVMRLRIAFSDGMSLGLLSLDGELLRELAERLAELLLEVALELAAGAQLVEDALLARLHEGQELLLVP